MARVMKPGPFDQLREEAREYNINVDNLNASDEAEIKKVRDLIAERKAQKDLEDLQRENEQTVMIRVVEWADWIPATEFAELAEVQDPRSREMVKQKMPMHNGFSGFVADRNERLLDVAIQGTGHKKIVELDNNQDDLPDDEKEHMSVKKPQVVFGRYVFQATLARNVTPEFLEGVRDGQLAPLREQEEREKTEGRDRRSDLIVIENKVDAPPPPPNRNQRRGSKARRKR